MTFKTTSIGFIISVLLILVLHYFLAISLWWLTLPILGYKAAIIYGSASIQSNFYANVICKSDTLSKEIAISFDDGPNKEFTPKVLATLKENNVKATFFVIGKNIKGNEQILKQIDAEGHTIGNHTFSHSLFIDFRSKRGFINELQQTADAIFNIIGKRVKLFRPPYGVTTPNLARASKYLNYDIIGWSVRSLDTTNDSEQTIVNRILNKLKPGAIVLFHDTSEKSLNVLKQTINIANQNGFKIVTIDQLLTIKPYE